MAEAEGGTKCLICHKVYEFKANARKHMKKRGPSGKTVARGQYSKKNANKSSPSKPPPPAKKERLVVAQKFDDEQKRKLKEESDQKEPVTEIKSNSFLQYSFLSQDKHAKSSLNKIPPGVFCECPRGNVSKLCKNGILMMGDGFNPIDPHVVKIKMENQPPAERRSNKLEVECLFVVCSVSP